MPAWVDELFESSAEFNSAEFDDLMITHRGWGFCPGAISARLTQVANGARSFSGSLHLFAREIEEWPAETL